MATDRNDTSALADVLSLFRRRIVIVLVCALAVPASALIFSLHEEKEYTAKASLLFRDPEFDQKLFSSSFLQQSRDPDREAATNVRLASLDLVSRRTQRLLPKVDGRIDDKVTVSAEGQSDLVSVAATDNNPKTAAVIANTFARQFIVYRRAADRAKTKEAQQLVRDQLAQIPPEDRGGTDARSLRDRSRQLQILASLQTGNAELAEAARPPGSPSSPKIVRNTVLGFFFGLLLGIGLALIIDRLDRRIRNPKEVEGIFKRPLLGAIPESRELAKGGPAQEGLPPATSEAFRLLRANLRYFNVDRDVRSVLITSAAPGDGKSTVAWSLASAAAGAGVRTLLIEADLRRPSIGPALGLGDAAGLSTLLAGEAEPNEVVRQVFVADRQNGHRSQRTLDVLPSGPLPPNPSDLVESDRMREILQSAERRYDFVVVDTPPTSLVSDAIPLVGRVGGVIVVGRVGSTNRDAVVHLRNQLENLDAPTLGVVVNAMGRRSDSYGYSYVGNYG